MEKDAILGVIVLIASLSFLTYLTLWSGRALRRIHSKGPATARELLKEHRHGD